MEEMNLPINDINLVFLDLETTGLSVEKGDEIIEFGAVKTLAGNEIGHLESLIRPSRTIPPESTKIHGISDLFVTCAPAFKEYAPQIQGFCANAVLIAHNAPFDVGFLVAALERAEIPLPANTVFDTVGFARALQPELPNHKLQTLKAHHGVKASRSHRALDDSRALSKVFWKMVESYFPMLGGGPTLATVTSRAGGVFILTDFRKGLPLPNPEHRALVRRGLREKREVLVTVQAQGRLIPDEVRIVPCKADEMSTSLIGTDRQTNQERAISFADIRDIRSLG